MVFNACWVVLTQFWVKYGQTQLLGYIFKLVHILPQNWVKTTQHFLECAFI